MLEEKENSQDTETQMPLCHSEVLLHKAYNLKQRVRRKDKWIFLWDARWRCKDRAGSWKDKVGHLLNEVAMCHNNHRQQYRHWSYGLGMRLCNAMCDFSVPCVILCSTNTVNEVVKNENLQLPFSFSLSPFPPPFHSFLFLLTFPLSHLLSFVFHGPQEIHGWSTNWTVPYEHFSKC